MVGNQVTSSRKKSGRCPKGIGQKEGNSMFGKWKIGGDHPGLSPESEGA